MTYHKSISSLKPLNLKHYYKKSYNKIEKLEVSKQKAKLNFLKESTDAAAVAHASMHISPIIEKNEIFYVQEVYNECFVAAAEKIVQTLVMEFCKISSSHQTVTPRIEVI